MRVPIAVQLGLLVLLTSLVGIAVLAAATVRNSRPLQGSEGSAILTTRLVDHNVRLCRGCQVRVAFSLKKWYS